MTNKYPPIEEVREQLKERRKDDRRVCAFKGFGKVEPHICTCDAEERQWCRDNYDLIKKEQYVDSKGQNCFTDGSKD